nr:MAG TPA: hypothetical protein [Caudoviricetes sp.]
MLIIIPLATPYFKPSTWDRLQFQPCGSSFRLVYCAYHYTACYPIFQALYLGFLKMNSRLGIFIFRPPSLFCGRVFHKLSTGFPQA